MENGGWIYFRVDEGRGFCFGKTDDPTRRDAEYRKENPWIRKVYDFYVADMHAVEQELITLTAGVRLLANSKEWIRLCEESRRIVDEVRKKHALMTHEQWQQTANDELKRQVASEPLLASQSWWAQHYADWKEALARIPPDVHEQQHAAYKKQLTVFRDRDCPHCRVPATYDAALTGYRCTRCNSRCE